MAIDFTPLVRKYFESKSHRTDIWGSATPDLQQQLLRSLLKRASDTEIGHKYNFAEIASLPNPYSVYKERVQPIVYEDIRPLVDRMIKGEENILWHGKCLNYAQSSGTSGGKSKFIPITKDSLNENHYIGGRDAVAHYLRNVTKSKMFAGKGLILGGSFSTNVTDIADHVKIGDLSATLIDKINPLANLVRVPSHDTALLSDWEEKLPHLVQEIRHANVTNLSGVPSWMMTVLRTLLKEERKDKICEIWHNIEVFFHGGISFEPYREEYARLIGKEDMHYLETYNASEGFFAVQNDLMDSSMLLLIDAGLFFEFAPFSTDGDIGNPVGIEDIEKGRVYELIISGTNGLWRYHTGDTIKIESTSPVKITIAGRTGAFINAFGEELMQHNAERAIAVATAATNSSIRNYSVAPIYSEHGNRGCHQWMIEWERKPESTEKFMQILDKTLCDVNSDYDAKRSHTIFLDPPSIINARDGLFDKWLSTSGSGKLGGQRKIPRLCNSRKIMDELIKLNNQQ